MVWCTLHTAELDSVEWCRVCTPSSLTSQWDAHSGVFLDTVLCFHDSAVCIPLGVRLRSVHPSSESSPAVLDSNLMFTLMKQVIDYRGLFGTPNSCHRRVKPITRRNNESENHPWLIQRCGSLADSKMRLLGWFKDAAPLGWFKDAAPLGWFKDATPWTIKRYGSLTSLFPFIIFLP